jgi:copper(I)-binding protein
MHGPVEWTVFRPAAVPKIAPRLRFTAVAALATLLASGAAVAQVAVADAWVRGTVVGQRSTGAFMTLTAPADAALVGAASPAAKIVEIHQMTMEGGVAKMRAVPRIELPAGKRVALEPGGYHVMLMALQQPLKEGETVRITLTFEQRDGKRTSLDVNAPVRPLTQQHKH